MPRPTGSSPARISRLVAAWRESGESRAEFARRHGIHPRTFWGWCQRVRARPHREPRAAAPEVPRFAPVHVVTTPDATPDVPPAVGLEIVLASGDRVRVAADVPEARLLQVLAALRRPC